MKEQQSITFGSNQQENKVSCREKLFNKKTTNIAEQFTDHLVDVRNVPEMNPRSLTVSCVQQSNGETT